MPRTADHITEAHNRATARRRRGQPSWRYEIPEFGTTLATYDDQGTGDHMRAVRDRLVSLIKSSAWYAVEAADEFSELHETVDEFSTVADPDIFSASEAPGYNPHRHFRAVIDRVYDLADFDRCWLAP